METINHLLPNSTLSFYQIAHYALLSLLQILHSLLLTYPINVLLLVAITFILVAKIVKKIAGK